MTRNLSISLDIERLLLMPYEKFLPGKYVGNGVDFCIADILSSILEKSDQQKG